VEPTLTIDGDRLELRVTFADKYAAKEIPGYRFERRKSNYEQSVWSYPVSAAAAREIVHHFPRVNMSRDAQAAVEKSLWNADLADALKARGTQLAAPLREYPIRRDVRGADGKLLSMYQHQILASNLAMLLPSFALMAEVGTSKTVVVIAAAGRRYLDGEIRRVLVVAPKSVVQVWPREFAKWANFPFDVRALTGSSARRVKMLHESQWDSWERECGPEDGGALQVAVTNYESTWRIADAIAQWAPDMIVADEFHRIKTPGASQSKAMHKLGEIPAYKIGLSGTPVSQHPLDIFSPYKFMDATIFGTSYGTFRNRHAIMGGFEGREVVAYKDLEGLERRMHSIGYRVTKEECLDLPPVTPTVVPCELEPSAKKIYDAFARDATIEIEEGRHMTGTNVLTKTLRLRQIAGGFLTDDDGLTEVVSTAKMEVFDDLLATLLDAGEKVIVFATFVAELDAIIRLIEKRKVGYVTIRGGIPDKIRNEAESRFQNDDSVRVFVGQLVAAGEGITLVAARNTIFYSWDYSLIHYEQASGRDDRPGQTRTVTHHHIVCDGTPDVGSLEALQRKRNVADAVVDGQWRNLISGRSVIAVNEFAK